MKDGTVIHRIGDDGCYMTKKANHCPSIFERRSSLGCCGSSGHDRVCFRGASPRADIVSV